MKKISVITGVLNEEEIVRDVYEQIKNIFKDLASDYEYEHIFLDNASTDRTLEILKGIAANDKNVKVLSYSKNFGSIKSEMTGYRHATGDAVITFEGSLKDPAELIPEFIRQWEQGYQVVYGVRNKTSDNLIMGLLRKIFYIGINAISEEKLQVNVGTYRLIDRKVVNELVKLDDYKPYIRGLIASIGFKQKGISYKRKARLKGKSKSNLFYLIDFAINGLVSYSILPIRFCTYIGFLMAVFSFLFAIVYLVLKVFFWPVQIPAVAGLLLFVLIVSGVQLFFLGVIGEYVGAIHSQVRKKPFVIIREKINF
ncbi:MAG: glycosyltransferase family 2 protein [Candidatus Omnitrophica bacterium]|jgi:glycosyltransferase involved in cell wall biosynthesis|nr:glycosyltransferase family 2 protein [Candidatus Omnitrophota bacterium]